MAAPLEAEPTLWFEVVPTEWFSGEVPAAVLQRPPAATETVVLTRTGLHIRCWDHPGAGQWRAYPGGARLCAECYPPREADAAPSRLAA